ncbi:hypothetical protein CDO73_09800 [Saccharibacillus sp. O23]|nr:hypothetical protein CDO73_09800 [Saccharibacillus sp. O23]
MPVYTPSRRNPSRSKRSTTDRIEEESVSSAGSYRKDHVRRVYAPNVVFLVRLANAVCTQPRTREASGLQPFSPDPPPLLPFERPLRFRPQRVRSAFDF